MPTDDGNIIDIARILLVFAFVFANGFFVAAEFSLVAVRRSRIAELVSAGRSNAKALQRAVDHLDAYLAGTQLGITISSLALGWIGEPALAHLIEPLLAGLPLPLATIGSHALAVALAFTIITALHIVLGELAPKSLALQRSERTALFVVRPLDVFLFIFRPAISSLNALGNLVLRLFGLGPGTGEGVLHSPDELKLLVAASHEAGLLHQVQQEVVERVLNIAERRVTDIMTPRLEVEWFDIDDHPDEILRTIRACRHEQLLAGRGNIDEPLGMVVKQDLLDQMLDGKKPDPVAAIREPLVVHESSTIFRVLDQFKRSPSRLALIVDEYGILEGIVTQTDLLEAIAGNLPDSDEEPEVVERADGSLLIDGMMAAPEAFERLGIRDRKVPGDFHTAAGFVLTRLGHLPDVGENFSWEGWRFEVVDMDGHRIDKLLVTREESSELSP
jgi:CBS domain containing-hemolysin-like protein